MVGNSNKSNDDSNNSNSKNEIVRYVFESQRVHYDSSISIQTYRYLAVWIRFDDTSSL